MSRSLLPQLPLTPRILPSKGLSDALTSRLASESAMSFKGSEASAW